MGKYSLTRYNILLIDQCFKPCRAVNSLFGGFKLHNGGINLKRVPIKSCLGEALFLLVRGLHLVNNNLSDHTIFSHVSEAEIAGRFPKLEASNNWPVTMICAVDPCFRVSMRSL